MTTSKHLAALAEENATLKRLWNADCDDMDKLLERLGLGDKATIAQEYRSEGGFLRVGKIENAIRGKLSQPVAEMAQLLEYVAGKGDKAVWLSNGWREDVNNVLSQWREQTTCPTCHGKGATAPNGVQYCNCPEVT